MPSASAPASPPPVHTRWPFLPMTMAVPVSWHIGSTLPAAMLAFFRRSKATKRSLADASGSSRMARSWRRWPGRSRCWHSTIASCASKVSAGSSTLSMLAPSNGTVPTWSPVRRRYGVSSSPSGNSSWKTKSFISRLLGRRWAGLFLAEGVEGDDFALPGSLWRWIWLARPWRARGRWRARRPASPGTGART